MIDNIKNVIKYHLFSAKFLFMFFVCSTLVLFSTMFVFPLSTQNTNISISDILSAVQNNVDFLKEHLADFVSDEEITIEEFDNKGRIKTTTNIIFQYRVFAEGKHDGGDCDFVYGTLGSFRLEGIFHEERVMLSAKENNKTRKVDSFRFDEPIWAKGHPYSDFIVLFDRQYESCFNYQLKGMEKINGRNAYVVEITKKETFTGESEKKNPKTGEIMSWQIAYNSKAFIDAEDMELVQLNRDNLTMDYHLFTAPYSADSKPIVTRHTLNAQNEYAKIKIRNQFLNLPITKTVELFRENGQPSSVYKYRYVNYKAFNADTKISFSAIEESLNEIMPEADEYGLEK